ncbi:MAG: TAXI family TRAP transporter solute-binding subunit [Geminicoccaceae bacterium]
MSMTLRACVMLFVLCCPFLAKAEQHKLAASTINSPYHAAGVALEAVTSIYLMPDHGIKLRSVSTTGVRDNIEQLSKAEVDFAIIPSLAGFQARTGTGAMAHLGPQKELRAVAMLVPTIFHALLRKSLLQSGTIDDLFMLEGQRLNLGLGASEAEDVARFMFQQNGVNADGFDDLLSERPQTLPAFLDGEIDALLTTGSLPNVEIEELLAVAENDVAMVSVTEDQIRQANSGLDLVVSATIPAGTYFNQKEAVQTLALPVFLATRADVDEETVYQIVKIMFEQVGLLRTIHPAMEALDFETAIDNLPVPLHPGAVRYYGEYGLSIADATSASPDYSVYTLSADDPEQRRIDTNSGVVGIMVDPDATSLQAASELAVVVNSEPSDVRVVVQRGEGSAKTVNDLLYMKGVDLGIVQADVLENLRHQDGVDWLPGRLRYLAKLYDSDVHILVRDDIQEIQDLAGKTVNFGPLGSASEIAAANIFSQLGIAVVQSSDPSAFALEKLERGDVEAVVMSGGKPMPSLASIEPSSGLRLLDIPNFGHLDVYQPSSFISDDYPNLIQPEQNVRTLSVSAMLMAYKWPENSDRYALLSDFYETFEQRLDQLQLKDRFHPTWQGVSLTVDFEGWTRSSIAADLTTRRGELRKAEPSLPAPHASPLPILPETEDQVLRRRPINGPA